MTKKVELPSLERRQRRPAGFWQMFNVWWRKELDNAGGIRPPTSAVRKWYAEYAEAVWPDASTRPCWRDCRVHAKCLKSTEEVKEYFRKYRCGKKPGANGTAQARGRTANESNSDSDAGEDEIASNYVAGRVQPARQYANQVPAFPLGGLPGAAVLMHSSGLGQKLQASSAPTWTPVGMPAAATPLSLPAGTGQEAGAGAGPRPKHKPDTLIDKGVPPQAGIGTSRPPPGATGPAPVLQPWHQGELARLAQLQNIKLEGNMGVSCPLVPPASQVAVPFAPLLRPVRIRPAGHSSAPGGSAGAANLVGLTKAGGHDGQLQAAGLAVLPVESVSGLLSNAVTREQLASHAPDSPWKPDLPACVSASALASIVKEEQHTRTYQPGNRPPTPLSFSSPAPSDNAGLWHTANDGLRAQLCSQPAVQLLLWAPQAAPGTVPTPDTAKAAARSLAGGHEGVAEEASAPGPSILSFGCKAGTSFGIHGCGDCEMEEQKQVLPFAFEQKHPVGLKHGAHETQLAPLPSWIPAPLSAPPLTSSDHHHLPALVPHLPISTRRSQPWPTPCEPPACMDPGAWVTAARRSSERNSHASHDGGAHEDMFDDRGQAVLDDCGVELGTDMAGYSAAAAAAAAGAEPPFLYPASPVRPSATLQRLRSRGSQPVTFTPFSGRSLRPDRSRWEQGMLAPASSPLAQCGSLEPAPSLLHPRTSSLHLQSALSSHSSDPGPFAPGAARLRAAEAQLLQAWHQADSGQLELRQHIQQQLDQVYREQRDWQQQRLRLQDRQQQLLQASGSRPHHHHHHPRQQQKQQQQQQPNHHWQAQAAEQQQQSTALEQPQYSQYTPAKQMLQGQRSWGRQTQPLPQPQAQLPSGPGSIHFMSRQPNLKQHQQLQLRPLESQPLSLDLAQLHCQQRQNQQQQQQQQQQQRPQASQPVPVPSDALWQLLMCESELGGNSSAAEATCVRGNAADAWLTTPKPAQHPALASARSSPASVPNATSTPGTAGAHQATPPSQPQPSTAPANAFPPYHPQQAQTAAAPQATLSPLPPHPVPNSPATDDKPTIGSLSADPEAPQLTAATMPSSPTPSSPLPTLHCAPLSSPPLHSLPSSISDHAHSLRGLLDTVSGSLPACSTQAAADSPEQGPGSATKQHHTPPCDSSAASHHVGLVDNSAAAQLASSASPARVPSSAAHEHMSVRSSCGKAPPAVKEQVCSVLGCCDAVALIRGSALATAGQAAQAAPSAAIDMQPRDPALPEAQDTRLPSTAAQQDPSGAGEASPAILLSDHPCGATLVVASGTGEEDPPCCVQAGYEAEAAAGLPAARGELGTVPSPRLALSACLRSISSGADRVADAAGPRSENQGSDPPPTPALELTAWLDTEAGNAVLPSPKVCDEAEVAVTVRSSPATALATGLGTHGPAEEAVEGVVAATKVMIAADQSTSALCCAPPAAPVTQRVNQRRSWADAQMDDSWGEDQHQQQQQQRQPPLLRAWGGSGSLQPSSPAAAAHSGGRADPFLDLATEVAERWAAAQQERMRRSSLGISVPLPLQSPDHRPARQCQPLCPMPDPAHVRQLPARWQDSQASAAQASEFWLQAMQPSAPHQHQRHGYAEEVEPRQSLRPSHPTQTSLSSHHLPGSHSHNCLAQLQPLSNELSRAPWAQPDRGCSYGAFDQPHHSLVKLQHAPQQAELVGQQNWHRHTQAPLPRFEAPRSAPLCTTVPYSSSIPQLPGQQARRGEAGQLQARPALQLHTRQHQHWLEQELELALQDAVNTGRRASGHAGDLHGQAPYWYHPAAAEEAAGEEQGVPRQWPAGQGSNGSQGGALHYTILPQEASMPQQHLPPQPALESGWAPLPAHQGLGGWRSGSMVGHDPRAQYESEQQQQQQQLQQSGSIRQPSMAWQVLELHDMLEDSGHLPRLRVEQQQSRQYLQQQRHVGQYMHLQQQQQIQRQQEQQGQWLMQLPESPPAAPQTGHRQVHASAGRLSSWVEAAGCNPPSRTPPQALPAPMRMAALDAPHPQQLRLQSQGGMAMDIDPGVPAAGAEDLASFFEY